MQVGLAMILATLMAVVTLVFHLWNGSSILILLLRTIFCWLGIALWVGLFSFLLRRVFSDMSITKDLDLERRHHLDHVNGPGVETGLENLLYK